MKVTILTLGTRGDLQPFVALGVALKAEGMDVKLVAHEEFRSFVEEYELEYAPLIGSASMSLKKEEVGERIKSKNDGIDLTKIITEEAKPFLAQAVRQYYDACVGADFIISYVNNVHIAYYISRKLDIPLVFVNLSPSGPTNEFPHLFVENKHRKNNFLTKKYNYYTHLFYGKVIWGMIRKSLQYAWREAVAPISIPLSDPLPKGFEERTPLILYAYSPAVLPKPKDWSEVQFVTGHWFLHSKKEEQPSADLEIFISKGDAPVYIGFGSMNNPNEEVLQKIIIPVLDELGLRAVMLKDGSDISAYKGKENLHFIDGVDFHWLFPKMKALVHHGGIGTTALALKSGVPSLAVTYIIDQRFWANRLHHLQASPKAIPRNKLTRELFKSRLEELISNKAFEVNTKALSEKMNEENGIKHSVELIHAFLNTPEWHKSGKS